MTLELDHVIVCVADLDSAATTFEERFGVRAVGGGRHPGHGTENRIIPLGVNYIELLAVADDDEAAGSPFGTWAALQAHGADAKAVCLRTDDLDEVCARLGLEASSMSRTTADGQRLAWRVAGLEHALPRLLPFFIQWDVPPDLHPGRVTVDHPAVDARLTSVAILGDHVDELRLWAPDPDGLDYIEAPHRGVTYHIASTQRAL
ncbi:MAG TPA: VOC family protein [Acidimicrobiia bacterium]